ncbi:MAG: hypothetical protein LAQ30_18825 [Acidobacteriia bacterium]|nr:hypothetical protein [Terriglobia bacterium]
MALILSLIPVAAFAAEPAPEIKIGERLPELRGESLTGREAVLPQAAEGRVTLLLLGFTYKSRFAVEAWAERFRARFQSDPRVTFYELPMIGGAARLARWFIDRGMRRGTPEGDHEHVITVYRGVDSWKRRVRFVEPDAAYLILLDRTGKVAWRHQGAFEDSAFQALSRKISESLN